MRLLLLLTLLAGCTAARKGTPMNPTSARLNHIALQVKDLGPATAFYTEVIGLDTIPEPFHDGLHTWMAIGQYSALHLIESRTPAIIPGKGTHLCFSLPDLDAFISRLKARGIPYEDWPGKPGAVTLRADGIRQVYLKDPDGYWIEINDDFGK